MKIRSLKNETRQVNVQAVLFFSIPSKFLLNTVFSFPASLDSLWRYICMSWALPNSTKNC